jgi:hypothetical protein
MCSLLYLAGVANVGVAFLKMMCHMMPPHTHPSPPPLFFYKHGLGLTFCLEVQDTHLLLVCVGGGGEGEGEGRKGRGGRRELNGCLGFGHSWK